MTKHVSVHAGFLHELKEANLLLYIWLHTDANMVDMYTENMSPRLYNCHGRTIVHDDNDEECWQYLHKRYWTSPTSQQITTPTDFYEQPSSHAGSHTLSANVGYFR